MTKKRKTLNEIEKEPGSIFTIEDKMKVAILNAQRRLDRSMEDLQRLLEEEEKEKKAKEESKETDQ